MCVNLCASNIYAWTNYFEQIFLCPGPCGFGLLDTLLFHVSLCQYAVVDSNQVYSSSTQPLRLDITLSSYLSDLEEGPYMCRKRSAIKLCPHNIENTVKENLLSLLSLFHRTFNSSHIFDTYPPTSLLKLLLIPELVPKYLSKVKVMSKYSALHQLDPRKIGAEGQTSLMQLFDGDNR